METEIVKQIANLTHMVYYATIYIAAFMWRLNDKDGGWLVSTGQALMGLLGLLGMLICFLAAR